MKRTLIVGLLLSSCKAQIVLNDGVDGGGGDGGGGGADGVVDGDGQQADPPPGDQLSGDSGGGDSNSGDPGPAAFWYELGGSALTVWPTVAVGSASSGGISASVGDSRYPALAVLSDGSPVVAWLEDSIDADEVRVRRWIVGAWQNLGNSPTAVTSGIGNDNGAVPCVAVDGYVYVAWRASNDIHLRRWSGSAWDAVGASAGSGGLSQSVAASVEPTCAATASGVVVVAWREATGSNVYDIHLRQWSGSAWIELGGSATGGGVSATATDSRQPSVALDSAGNPTVVWQELVHTNGEIYLARWTGTSWEELAGSATGGGISNTTRPSSGPGIDVDASGTPTVAWWNHDGTDHYVYLVTWVTDHWAALGGSASATGVSGMPAEVSWTGAVQVELDTQGRPVVAWSLARAIPGSATWFPEVCLRRWNSVGSTWESLGGSGAWPGVSDNGGRSESPSLALHGDLPVLAWFDRMGFNDEAADIYLRRFNGSAWEEYGSNLTGAGISDTSLHSSQPSLVLVGGRPVVAWATLRVEPLASRFQLREWTGTAWGQLGGSAPSGGWDPTDQSDPAMSPVLAVAGNGNLGLLWHRFSAGFLTHFVLWNGSSWVGLGGSATSSIATIDIWSTPGVALAFDDNNHPLAVWTSREGSSDANDIFVKIWTGSAWLGLGGSDSGGGISNSAVASVQPAVTFANGAPVVVWSEGPNIALRRWSGTAWEELDGSASGNGAINSPANSVAEAAPQVAAAHDGSLVVVWEQHDQIYARRWTGAAWQDLGTSSSGGGVSNTSGDSTEPSVAIGPDGQPFVVWRDGTNGNDEIYGKLFNGTSWVEVGNSAHGGGISATSGRSARPSVAWDDVRLCVAWEDPAVESTTVLVRCIE